MKVSLIGAGRVATHLATAFYARNIQIQQIVSRNITHAEHLAQQVEAIALDDIEQLTQVDIVLIAVSDAQIATVARQLAAINYSGLVVHTSGSTHLQVLQDENLQAGVFYPLQSFSFDQSLDWESTPLFLEATQQSDLQKLDRLAGVLSKKIYHYDSNQRLSLHLAAVFASNFSNYCYDIAEQILQQHQVDQHLILPLVLQTAQKLQYASAAQNQTGPARRHDQNIMDLHLDMLNPHPEWQEIYAMLSTAIKHRHPIA
ncbi:Rossmann-like and DUF2520 domain-containing protein [Acinetobacter populi]|jgi:predicted short-subunit dehydrogenase-like oxidoreductase (DUF2520 family)|uniref:F420-dependent NADP oxidoreductase n=1 Tax=Acinetobacter populi TaxID=1582270 RepID=A0A1Z9YZ70_9GAMM|nr:Rossmann-like and DUF2520 domain-containing protein [Acinetobacter populi]MCH4248188.1 DUF2520 domain-containing protein [Acinetobacter populi]OUY07477.1 F420-dependent NADP oxidoreductase [Acinetobacter populi]